MKDLNKKINNLATQEYKNTWDNNWESAVINICDFVTGMQKIGFTEDEAINRALEVMKEIINDKKK